MKPKHFQHLFSKEPIFEFFADKPAKSFFWICLEDFSFSILDVKERNASELQIGDKVISMKESHILSTGITLEPDQKNAIECFLESVFSYSLYEDVTIVSGDRERADLLSLIPASYNGSDARCVISSL